MLSKFNNVIPRCSVPDMIVKLSNIDRITPHIFSNSNIKIGTTEYKSFLPGVGHTLTSEIKTTLQLNEQECVDALIKMAKSSQIHIFSNSSYELKQEQKQYYDFKQNDSMEYFQPRNSFTSMRVPISIPFLMQLFGDVSMLNFDDQILNLSDNVKQPLKQETFKQMTEKEYKDTTGCNTNCTICLEDYKPTDIVKQTICNHTFHPSCLKEWTKDNHTCPNCKGSLGEYDNVDNGQIL